MAPEMRLSQQGLRVLALMMARPRETLSGADIGRETRVGSGTLYPFLSRLEKGGWAESEWEAGDPSELGRPRRRLYRLTGKGYNAAQAALAEIGVFKGGVSWAT